MGFWQLSGKWLIIAGMVSLLAMGCSEKDGSDMKVESDLPANLALVQGTWSCGCTSTNGLNCQITIDDYTIRLRYQESTESPVVRESSGIDHIDEDLQAFVLSGDSGAWPYEHGYSDDGMEYMELEFFSQGQAAWKRLRLLRIENEGS